MSLISRIKSWFQVPPGTKLVVTDKGKIMANVISQKGVVSSNFTYGIEIINDNTTPADYVVSILMDFVGMKQSDATAAMLICHSVDSVLVELERDKDADEIVRLIMTDARKKGYPLVCKVASAHQHEPVETHDG